MRGTTDKMFHWALHPKTTAPVIHRILSRHCLGHCSSVSHEKTWSDRGQLWNICPHYMATECPGKGSVPAGAVSDAPQPSAQILRTHSSSKGYCKVTNKRQVLRVIFRSSASAVGCFLLQNVTHTESHDALIGFTIPISSSAAWLIRYYYLLCVFFPRSLSLFLWQGCCKRTQ